MGVLVAPVGLDPGVPEEGNLPEEGVLCPTKWGSLWSGTRILFPFASTVIFVRPALCCSRLRWASFPDEQPATSRGLLERLAPLSLVPLLFDTLGFCFLL